MDLFYQDSTCSNIVVNLFGRVIYVEIWQNCKYYRNEEPLYDNFRFNISGIFSNCTCQMFTIQIFSFTFLKQPSKHVLHFCKLLFVRKHSLGSKISLHIIQLISTQNFLIKSKARKNNNVLQPPGSSDPYTVLLGNSTFEF